MSSHELDASHPPPTEYDQMGLAEIARIGLEFEYGMRVRELDCIFVGDPPSRFSARFVVMEIARDLILTRTRMKTASGAVRTLGIVRAGR